MQNRMQHKVRLDKLLLERGLTTSRERAQALILSGKVLVNEQKIEKSGAAVDTAAVIRLIGEDLKFVSRGGLKLEKALDEEIEAVKKDGVTAASPIVCCSGSPLV